MSLYKFFIELNKKILDSLDIEIDASLSQQEEILDLVENAKLDLFQLTYENEPQIYLLKYIELLTLLKNNYSLAKDSVYLSKDIQQLRATIEKELREESLSNLYKAYHTFKKEIPAETNTQTILASFKQAQNLSTQDINELTAYLELVNLVIKLEAAPTVVTELFNTTQESILYFQMNVQKNESFAKAIATRLVDNLELNSWLLTCDLEPQTRDLLKLELNHQKHFAVIVDNALDVITQKSTELEAIEEELSERKNNKEIPNTDRVSLYTQFLTVMQDWSQQIEEFNNMFSRQPSILQEQYAEFAEVLANMQQKKIPLLQQFQDDLTSIGYGFKEAMNKALTKTPALQTWVCREINNLPSAPNLMFALEMH